MTCKMTYDYWNVLNVFMHSVKCSDDFKMKERIFAYDLTEKIKQEVHQELNYQKRIKLCLSEDEVIEISNLIERELLENNLGLSEIDRIHLSGINNYLIALIKVHSWETYRV